jgi:hypothetical protein
MIVFALAGLLLATEPVSDAVAPSAALLALPAADEDIRQALFEMHVQDPERRVCTTQVLTGSRQARQTCGTLKEWFATRSPGDVLANKAPWQLVEEIKKQRRKVNVRRGG